MEDKDLTADLEMLASKEDEMYEAASPKGRWTDRGLNVLVKASNKMLPLFSQEPTYPTFSKGEYTELPADFMRVLSMFASASADAADAEIIEPELVIDIAPIRTDEDLMLVASRLTMLAKDKGFAKFLKRPVEEKEKAPSTPTSSEPTEMTDDQMTELFTSRMK